MDSTEPNEAGFDPNEPDCSNGDFFCRLCLSSTNSESMWSSHIAGKRHIKNAQKFPKGLPTRDVLDEDSYDRPAKRERFDDGYDLHDDCPKPKYDDGYYGEGYYDRRPPMDYKPAVKPNIVIDYGHIKNFQELPPEINKVIAPPSVLPPSVLRPSVVPPTPIPSVSRPLPVASPVDFGSVLDTLLKVAEQHQPPKDDFFEKLNQREMAKEIANELVKKGIALDSLKSVGEKKDDDSKASFSRDAHDKPSKLPPDILDLIYNSSEKKLKVDDEKRSSRFDNEERNLRFDDERRNSRFDEEKRNARFDNERRNARFDNERRNARFDDDKKKSRYDGDKKRSRDDDDDDDKKKSKFDDEKDSKRKCSSLKMSTSKSKLDDLDPDELTPDDLDALLSAHLKSKKTGSSDEICNKKHCIKNQVDLNDPKIIIQKLEELPTMDFLKIIHKKLVNLELKSSEELKLLLKVIAEAQVALSKKLPPELQALVKAKLSGSDGGSSQLPVQMPVMSQNKAAASSTSSSNAISQNPVASVPISQQTSVSVTPTAIVASPRISAVPFQPLVPPPPIPNIPMAPNQSPVLSLSNAARPQMQIPMAPTSQANIVSGNNPTSSQNAVHNYYNTIFSMYQNRQSAPSNVPIMNVNQQLVMRQQLPMLSRFPPPPPNAPPPRYQFSQNILDTVMKLKNQAEQSAKQTKQETQVPKGDSPPKSKEEILAALKNLDILQQEYKRKKLLKAANENKK